ncbi:MAG: hypothetical protein HQL20_10490 [Candidatus Omnitrophica bacterium]|nr:hypothetical protein [Candidatus Omnitrophota bacterium]
MKAYTLRLEDNEMQALKYVGIEERRPLKDIIVEMIRQRATRYPAAQRLLVESSSLDARYARVKHVLRKISAKSVAASIRKDRDR